jgi:hypothetical protein
VSVLLALAFSSGVRRRTALRGAARRIVRIRVRFGLVLRARGEVFPGGSVSPLSRGLLRRRHLFILVSAMFLGRRLSCGLSLRSHPVLPLVRRRRLILRRPGLFVSPALPVIAGLSRCHFTLRRGRRFGALMTFVGVAFFLSLWSRCHP